MSSEADVIKADVLALPGLSTALGDDVSEMAWLVTIDYVNEWNMEALGETAATTKYARMLLAAHLMLSTKRAFSGVAGPVTSRAAGQVRQSFGLLAQAAGTNNWNGTIYGQQLLAVIGSSMAHGPIVV